MMASRFSSSPVDSMSKETMDVILEQVYHEVKLQLRKIALICLVYVIKKDDQK